MADVGDLLSRGAPSPRARLPPGARTAVVVRADAGGTYVSPLGSDRTQPLKVKWGTTRTVVVPGPNGTHTHAVQLIPERTVVLLVTTDRGYWIAAAEEA